MVWVGGGTACIYSNWKAKAAYLNSINFKRAFALNRWLYMIAKTHFALEIPFLIKLPIQPIEVFGKHFFLIKHSTVNGVVK